MNWLDIVILILLLIGLWKGYVNGFFVEVATLVALIAAVYGALYFSNYSGDWLRSQFDWDEIYVTIASFVITFVVIIFVITYVGKLVTKLFKSARLGFLNKLAGAAFGLIKLAFIASVILMMVNTAVPIPSEEVKKESITYSFIEPLGPMLLPKIVEEANAIDQRLRQTDDELIEQPIDTLGSY